MITVRLRGGDGPAAPAVRHRYRVAGHDIACDTPLAALAPFAVGAPEPTATDPPTATARAEPGVEVFRGPAFVCGSTREVTCTLDGRGHDLEVGGVGRFTVTPDGARVALVATELSADDPAVAEAVLGPALTLALALRGTFCLHASAVASQRGALLFLGPSGAGKSTLAAGLARARTRLALLCDDITPIVPGRTGVVVRPRFPQLKLPADRQPALLAEETIALAAAHLLDAPDPGATAVVALKRLDAARAVAALVRHTVAVRLFGRALAAAYLDALAAGPPVPVRTLRYPRTHAAIADVADALDAAAGGSEPE